MAQHCCGSHRTNRTLRVLRIHGFQHSGHLVQLVVRRSVCCLSRGGWFAGSGLLPDLDRLLSEKQRVSGAGSVHPSVHPVFVQRNHDQIHPSDSLRDPVRPGPHRNLLAKREIIRDRNNQCAYRLHSAIWFFRQSVPTKACCKLGKLCLS